MNTSPGLTRTGSATFDVRPLDVHDDAALREWYRITEAADAFERPWNTNWSYGELAIELRTADEGARWEVTAAYEDGRMVGAGLRIVPLLDNVDKVYAGVYVAPQDRRRGIGSALVDELVAATRAEGRTEILVDTGVPQEELETHPYTLFARKHGFHTASVEVHRQLDLPVPAETLLAMQADASTYHQDYRLETYVDVLPEEVVESYCYLVNQLGVDAPTGDVEFEPEAHNPALHRKHEARMRQQGRHQLTTLALTADGEAVAVTDLVVPAVDTQRLHQWATLVRRDHRGHHLGAAVKVQNLLRLQELFPDSAEVHTTNEESNDAMIGINARLGFRVVEVCPEFQLKLG